MKREYKWCSLCRALTIQRKTDQGWLCDKCHPEKKEIDAEVQT